ncbi:constitutive coactivator of PPAR-gamma-like protein 1 isoform X2 [Episyrphus balteatus]|uniref:constitutive coactivator of PPAR-gamma-like protein 1 isoform X2 n=1 Tax=Episyrphus balteatus TaxID=286459 RepID=UPI002485B5F6|nr:constitutive coactivator of PPAR-gamma-like protein 1 isoform X2 [Episyrphus balteatus]
MIDPADLQTFLSKVDGGAVGVDLFKIGQKHHDEHAPTGKNNKHNGNFRVALDIEDCLDRFYGGYYSDWACGGQWNRAYQFVQLLASAFKHSHVEVIAFFDGTLKKNKKCSAECNDFRQKTISVLKHIRMIGTPPPKIWWLPPSGIKTVLRNALRSVHIQIVQTVNDHTMEVIEHFHEQKLDGILGLHPDYIIANTTRYFSSHDLRLSYKGALETKEFMISKLLASLSLTADHLPFVAVFLGGYILIDEAKWKVIYERLKIDSSLDFEGRIRKIAEIVRNSPTTDIDEFIKHLSLAEYEKEIKESLEYYQRKGKFSAKKYQGSKKRNELIKPVAVTDPPMPFASETAENDEAAKKILSDAVAKDDEVEEGSASGDKAKTEEKEKPAPTAAAAASSSTPAAAASSTNGAKTLQPFVYTLPAEVLKTSLNRHQRGIMDPRIYQLLIKKEIILPQVLEDEQYREIPSVHLFYRPARQMIYAILFNLYHQKYLCSKRNGNNNESSDKSNKKENKKDKKDAAAAAAGSKPPEIQVAEWIWSPQNEYKKPALVSATPLPWAVPTIQRLWFGMAFDDKQRRMRAFLTIMRSDSPLMLNRGYVPQHMLVMACVLRYIVTSPDRNILTRQELDAFLATAFSQQLPMVENTQELVLPGVHLRGVYLATLFMQGVETASLANDACGVPLPWTMINPWLFFDGKLFHLKLKMSTYVSTIRELCDDHIEIVLKIERFRKAILEDVEHFLLPAAHMDPMYRPGLLPQRALSQRALSLQQFSKNCVAAAAASQYHPLTAAANANNAILYNTQSPYFALSSALLGREAVTGVNPPPNNGGRNRNQMGNRNGQNRKGYQLKVGVTGSWAGNNAAAAAAASRSLFGPLGGNGGGGNRMVGGGGNRLNNNLAARIGMGNRGKLSLNARLNRNANVGPGTVAAANIANRNLARNFAAKVNIRSRNRNKRKDNRAKNQAKNKKSEEEAKVEGDKEGSEKETTATTTSTSKGTESNGSTSPDTTTSEDKPAAAAAVVVAVATKTRSPITIKTKSTATTVANATSTTPTTAKTSSSSSSLPLKSSSSSAETTTNTTTVAKVDKVIKIEPPSSPPSSTVTKTNKTATVAKLKPSSAQDEKTIEAVLDQIGSLTMTEPELKNELVA